MNCSEAQRLIGAEPERADAVLDAHLSGCEDCQRFRSEMRALNADIHRALNLPLAAWRQQTPPAQRTRVAPRWAMAAGVMLAFVSGLVFWALQPTNALATDLVTHMAHEPQSWQDTTPVERSALEQELRDSGVRIDLAQNEIVYVRHCWFRGHFVPHLVVRTTQGPLTVMILEHESVASAQHFSEDGYTGVLLPAEMGTIAVVGLGPAIVDEPARRIVQAIHPRE
jgi:hypothetical protein